MVNDDERREVARRLREVQSYVIPGTKTEENPITGRIIGVACGYDLPDFQGLLGHLADLIEPVERMCLYYDADTNHCGCYDTRLIDRDALLALVDDLMEEAQMADGMSCHMGEAAAYRYCACRIRGLLGVGE